MASCVTAPRTDDETKVTFCFSGDTRQGYKPFTVMHAVRVSGPTSFSIWAIRFTLIATGQPIHCPSSGTNTASIATTLRRNAVNAETSTYVMWDDHEVDENYLPGHPLAPIGRQAFLDYWPVRRSAAEPEQIYRAARWGRAVDLIILIPGNTALLIAAPCSAPAEGVVFRSSG